MPTKLTDKFVERARGTTYDTLATGLGIKQLSSGKRVWVFQSIFPGYKVQARRTLGEFPSMGLAEARTKAALWRDLVKNGIDPKENVAATREKQEADRRAKALLDANTFASVAERFIAERSNNRRAAQDAAEIRRILVTVWGEKPVGKITTGDVKDLINRIKVKAPYSARTTWTHLIGIFKMAVHEEMLEASPMASLDRRLLFKNCKIGPRQRTLNDSEVAAYWSASKKMPYPFGPFYQLLLLTGVRVSELTGAQWSEINPEVRRWMREAKASGKSVDWSAVDNNIKTWTVPRERFKSDAEHIVPLSNAALSIIETIPPVRRLRLSV